MTSKAGKTWILPALGSLAIWGVWGFLPKLALQTLPPSSVLFYESLGNLVVVIPMFLFFMKGKLKKEKTAILISAGGSALMVAAILFFFYALKQGPIAVIVTLTALYPVISLILARIVLKEKLNRFQWMAVGLAIGAVVLLAG